jgi:hypothetical protein
MDRSTGIEIYLRVPHADLSKMELLEKDKRCGASCFGSGAFSLMVGRDYLVSVP